MKTNKKKNIVPAAKNENLEAKDWFDDFMEYKMVTESEDENDTGSGNNPGCFPYLLGAILILYVISKLFS